ncbi:MAG: hypothetical protein K2K94_01225, partial [Muribaculaceae bacterium]|nr:hypothetical protein [Muribaculaceae bacterium]
ITKLFYNLKGKYLLIVYADSNIDMLYDDGRCYCLSEIKDAVLNDDKSINDIAFGDGRFVVVTNFGLVIYDDVKREVVESGLYHSPIETVGICGDNILIYSPYAMKVSKMSDRHNKPESFAQLRGMYTDRIIDISDDKIAWKNKNNNTLVVTTIFFDQNRVSENNTGIRVDSPITECAEGFYFKSGNKVLIFDNEGNNIDEFALTDELAASEFGLWKGKSSVWFANSQGTANYDMSGQSPTILSDWYKPEASSCSAIAYFYTSPDGERIYVGNLGPTVNRIYLPHISTLGADGIGLKQTTDIIENGRIRDVAIIEASATTSEAKTFQTINNDKGMYGGVTRLAEDPNDPDTYWIGNGLEGLYVVKDRKEVWKYDVNNAPFYSYWNTRIFDVIFDSQGNLWVGHAHDNNSHAPYIILPAAKLSKGHENITNEDWVWPNMPGFNAASKDFQSLFCKKSNYGFFVSSTSNSGFYVLDTKGTYDSVNDDKFYNFSVVLDQDGNTLEPEYYYSMAEDKLGRVWLGTSQGIIYINAAAGIDENSTVVRPKVPRNDGTNYADFLLDSDQINSIAVDHSNRKWIATDYSGVYLVSENGDRIIKHFDESNSPLPSNRVTAVVCDKNDNTVYFGTTEGLFSYKSDSSPAFEDFSDIYAYPNPVRPEYSGDVTIAGLMDGTLVKIADQAGNVFYQGRSEGGMVRWNCCNQSGNRVKSGVYFVYVSSGGDGQNSSGAVTKIMVIN